MVNAKVRFFYDSYATSLESEVNTFLKQLDVRQIIKIQHGASDNVFSCMILFVSKEDIRDLNIDSVLDTDK